MNKQSHTLNWFEIPTANFNRAKKFYETIFDFSMETQKMGEHMMGFFPFEPGSGKVTGAIIHGEGYIPSANGAVLYLNGGEDLSNVLNKVENAGGRIVEAKKQIAEEHGYMAVFADTEGNHLALHSMN